MACTYVYPSLQRQHVRIIKTSHSEYLFSSFEKFIPSILIETKEDAEDAHVRCSNMIYHGYRSYHRPI